MNAPGLPSFATTQSALRLTTELLARELLAPSQEAPAWSPFEWGVARAVAVMHGICSLLANRMRWRGPAPWLQFLEQQRRQALARDAQIGATLAAVDDATRAAGLGVIALKGSALRPLALYARGERPQSDIDLLVRTDERADEPARLSAVLDELGYGCVMTTRRHTIFKRRDDKPGWVLGEHCDNPLTIEVHTRIAEALPATPVDITARLVPAQLAPGINRYRDEVALLLHLALHAAGNMRSHTLRCVQLHDIARLAPRLHASDWEEVADLPAAQGGTWWLAAPFSLVERYHPETFPRGLLEELRLRAPLALRRTLARQTLTDVSWSNLRIHALPGVGFARTPLEAARFVRSRLVPARQAMAELAATVDFIPALRVSGWYEATHGRRILRWLFGQPARVQTLVSLGAALSMDAECAETRQ